MEGLQTLPRLCKELIAMSKVRMQKRKAVLQKIIVSFDTLMSYFCLLCAFWHIARTCFARCWLARLFIFIHMSVTVMLHLINQAIQSINQTNKSIKQYNQSINQTNKSIMQFTDGINQSNKSIIPIQENRSNQ